MSFLSIWPPGTVIVQFLNFAIFFAVLNVVFLRPVASAIRRRRQYINSLVSDYDRYQAEAASLRAQAEGVRASARRDAESHVTAQRARASNEAAQLAADYAQRAQAIEEQADQKARSEFDAARADEPAAARGLADVILGRVLPEAS
jgi:F0F1-type ATP synthase membrane subunit b/b'